MRNIRVKIREKKVKAYLSKPLINKVKEM